MIDALRDGIVRLVGDLEAKQAEHGPAVMVSAEWVAAELTALLGAALAGGPAWAGEYACLVEDNETEGEEWRIFIPTEGNFDAIRHMAAALMAAEDDGFCPFRIEGRRYSATEVRVLTSTPNGSTSYAPAYTVVTGKLAPPADLVERLFEREGRDFTRFHAEVKRLAALPKDERRATLAALP